MNESAQTPEQRLARMERLQSRLGVELHVLERAIWSLVVTHPDPAAFARTFEEATERTTAVHLNDELVSDEVRETSHRLATELIGLARAVADQRTAHASGRSPSNA